MHSSFKSVATAATLTLGIAALALAGCDSSHPEPTESIQATASFLAGSADSPSDSYVRATLTLDFDVTVTSETTMYDGVRGTSFKTMTIDDPPLRYDIEAGYDAQGQFVYDQVALDAPQDPYTGDADGVRRVRIRGGRFEVLDAQGLPVPGGATLPTLAGVFGTSSSDPLVILDGIALKQLPTQGAARTAGGSTLTVTAVSTVGSATTVTTTARSSDPAIPDLVQRRVYNRVGSDHVLAEIQTDIATTTAGVRMSGRATVRFSNVTYARNAARDDARRVSTGPDPWAVTATAQHVPEPPCQLPEPGEPPGEQECEGGGGGGGGGGSNPCSLVPGGANVVYVHGIRSNGSAWGSASSGSGSGVVGPVRCALRIDSDLAPSLTSGGAGGTGRHTSQATELLGVVQARNKPQTIFVAHSQGGLISRRVAQTSWGGANGNVRAVVTTGTPHQGAVLARTLNPGPGTNDAINAMSGIVQYASQVYPNATRNYRAPQAVSHTAEIDSRISSNAIQTILRDNVQVQVR